MVDGGFKALGSVGFAFRGAHIRHRDAMGSDIFSDATASINRQAGILVDKDCVSSCLKWILRSILRLVAPLLIVV